MSVRNEVMLITYGDSMGKDFKELSYLLNNYFKDVISGVHILPFYPSSADRGFAPINYEEVDKSFGSWEDIKALSKDRNLMFDFMINHISRGSKYYKDFVEHKDNSPYADLFIRYNKFWPQGEPTQEDIDLIYKRKPRAPYIDVKFTDGSTEKIWCTFDEEQVDINISTEVTRKFIKDNLINLAKKGASIIRLDAFAYAIKKYGTNCFFVEPEIWELLEYAQEVLKPYDVEILPEIHEHYSIQLKIAEKGYWVYDFALPMLLLYTLYSGSNKRLINWLKICPRKQFTTLDTHDGIGIVDVKDLLSEDEINRTKEYLFSSGANVKKIYNTAAYNNLDIYQVNCTYYSALGNDDDAYVLARAIQFFTPGIPQVYYVGLLAGINDIQLIEETKEGRNINRHYYSKEEVQTKIHRPIMARLFNLMKFRNSFPAFNGDFIIDESINEQSLTMTWKNEHFEAILKADLKTHRFTIGYIDEKLGAYKDLKEI